MPAGFVNIGNTCYMNAVLQCFLRCSRLNALLNHTTINVSTPEQRFLKEYDDLRKMAMHGNVVIKPDRFLHFMRDYATHRGSTEFMDRRQTDVSEFIRFMVDAFHTAYCQDKSPTPQEQCKDMLEGRYQSPIIDTFFGVHVFIKESLAGEFLSSTPEPFFLLELEIPPEATALIDCLHAYAAPERVDVTDDSGNAITVTRRCAFARMPPVLFVALKRFNARKKIQQELQIPDELIIGPLKYTLVAVCIHNGSLNGGHYTACTLADTWIHFDDDRVTSSPRPSTKDGYCFVYEI